MKKGYIIAGIVVLIIIVVLMSLTGQKNNKLVATKVVNDEQMGKYTEQVVFTFNKNRIQDIQSVLIFDDEESAKQLYNVYSFDYTMIEGNDNTEKMDVYLDGKQLTIKVNVDTYLKQIDKTIDEADRQIVKSLFEKEGYTVK